MHNTMGNVALANFSQETSIQLLSAVSKTKALRLSLASSKFLVCSQK